MHPWAAPLKADLTGLPPVLLQVGELDVLRSEVEAMGAKLRGAGVDAECEVYPGLTHGFMRATGAIARAREARDSAGAWIRRIMVTTALNYLKRNRNYRDQMYFPSEHLHPVINEDASTILQAKEIAELIRQLPPGYQTIFNLHAIEGYSHVEIGELLGITDGTSRSQYARARSLLISWIQNYPVDKKKENYGRK